MTDVTNEQRAAWARLSNSPDAAGTTGSLEDDVALIVPLLPDSLTNPQPALPTEPGHYLDAHNDVVEMFEGEWYFNGARRSLDEVSSYAPLARLVPERPQVTRQELIDLLSSTINFSNGYRADQILALLARNSA